MKSGKVKVLGMTTQARTKLAPDWPSAREAGIADFDASIAFGDSALKPRPGGSIRPFCEPVTVTSTPHSSCR